MALFYLHTHGFLFCITGERIVIKRTDLGFEDGEDEDSQLRITLTSTPVHGRLLLRRDRVLQLRSVFKQIDINDGFIR